MTRETELRYPETLTSEPEIQTPEPETPQETRAQHPETQRPRGKEPPQVSLIDANAFAFVCNQPGTELYFMTMEEANATHLTSQEMGAPEPDPDLSSIPSKYHEFADLFSKKEADNLPPH